MKKYLTAPSEANSFLPSLPETARLFDLIFGEIVVEWDNEQARHAYRRHERPACHT